MNNFVVACIVLISLQACKKSNSALSSPQRAGFITYTILANNHFSDKANYQPFSKGELTFKVIFDSSAIYQSVIPENQYDVNKLFGFSEGNDHHLNSARIGWAWNKNALRLYAYAYVNGERKIRELATVDIEKEIYCAIAVVGNEYVFSAGQGSISFARSAPGNYIPGYMLYPYFGGDETAPHEIRIRIHQLN